FAEAVAAAVRHRKWVPFAAVGAVLVGLIVWLSWPGPTHTPTPEPSGTPTPPGAAKAPALRFAAEVHRRGNFHDLQDVDPPPVGESVRFRATIPANHHATLFLVTESGAVTEAAKVPPAPEERSFAHPPSPEPGKSGVLPLEAPGGTHLALLAVSPHGPVTAE